MTIFEFLSIAASIILALALGKLVSSIPHVFNRSKFDLVHSLLFVWAIMACYVQWWNIWPLNTYQEWDFLGFFILLLAPTANFLSVQILVSDSPQLVGSWSTHLSRSYRWFFLVAFATTLFSFIRGIYFLGTIPSVLGWVFASALLIGTTTDNRILHGSIAVTLLLISGTLFLS